MKKHLLLIMIIFIVGLTFPSLSSAQGMMGGNNTVIESDGHTAREEAEGKEIWDKLKEKQVECQNMTDDNYGSLGEYFMGQMMSNSHEAMNNRLIQMMGEEGEKQMHITMGKRMSGCETNASMSQTMMNMMMGTAFAQGFGGTKGGGNPMMGYGGWNNMMGGWNGFGLLGWLPMLLLWVLLILGVVAFIRYLSRSGQRDSSRTPLEILKERYVRGEIDKKEFEQMKKDLE